MASKSKTHKGLAKRLKKSSNGKLFHKPCGKTHLMSGMSAKRARQLRKWKRVFEADRKSWERQFGSLL